MKKTRTKWILIADAHRGKIIKYENKKITHVIPTLHSNDIISINNRDKGHHKPGNATNSNHFLEPDTPWKWVEKELFCQELTKIINENQEKFDSIILIAPPKILGQMRFMLSENVSKKVEKEINKDLTKLPLEELLGYIY